MPYNNMINQLFRQKENIENMINQYSQNLGVPPVQNIINTANNSSDIDVRFVNANEEVSNIIVSKKTLFIDEKNNKILLKEVDGSISKNYDIIIPKDAKDIKIEELETKLKELEERFNVQHTESIIAGNDVKSTDTSVAKPAKPATKAIF